MTTANWSVAGLRKLASFYNSLNFYTTKHDETWTCTHCLGKDKVRSLCGTFSCTRPLRWMELKPSIKKLRSNSLHMSLPRLLHRDVKPISSYISVSFFPTLGLLRIDSRKTFINSLALIPRCRGDLLIAPVAKNPSDHQYRIIPAIQ